MLFLFTASFFFTLIPVLVFLRGRVCNLRVRKHGIYNILSWNIGNQTRCVFVFFQKKRCNRCFGTFSSFHFPGCDLDFVHVVFQSTKGGDHGYLCFRKKLSVHLKYCFSRLGLGLCRLRTHMREDLSCSSEGDDTSSNTSA